MAVPEEEIVTENDEGEDMYFIQKGDCYVVMKRENGHEEQN